MATRTIANGGGNWNVTGTWVEGAVPTSADDVVATSTSGQLTIPLTVAAVCKSIDFTNYTNTFTYVNGVSLSVSGSIKFVSGMTLSGSASKVITLTSSVSATLTSAGQTIPWGLTVVTSDTVTLADSWTITGTLSFIGSSMTMNGNTMNVGGGLVCNNGSTVITGTTNLVLNGTGTWSATGTAALGLNLTINTSGTITVSGSVTFGGGKTLTYTAGTVVTTSSTLNFPDTSGATVNTSGITWNNIGFTATQTLTINSLLSASGTFTINAAVNATFAGTTGFSVGQFTINSSSASQTHTFVHAKTYTITSGFTANSAQPDTVSSFVSDSAGNQAIITLNYGTTCNVGLLSATDIDSSAGRTIWDYQPTTLSNATNWKSFSQPNTVSST